MNAADDYALDLLCRELDTPIIKDSRPTTEHNVFVGKYVQILTQTAVILMKNSLTRTSITQTFNQRNKNI